MDPNRDGILQDHYLDFVYAPIHATDGTVEGVFVHAYDETEKVLARSRIDALCEDALRAVRAREELLAVVSHDLRSPLGTVLMGATMIMTAEEGEAGASTKKTAKTIIKAANRMTRLIGDLLDLASLEAGNTLSVELERQDVVDVIRNAAELFEPAASAKQLELGTDLAGPVFLPCDADRVAQVVSNLIGNAIKFAREGGMIRVGARRADEEILVTVSDTGIGIPSQHLPHIFKPYWQADALRKRGAGLGLSIVKAIVETHGGRVWAESTPGQGATFYFTLPMIASTPAPRNNDE